MNIGRAFISTVSLTEAVYTYALTWWEVQHLSFELEVVARLCATENAFTLWADDFDSEVIELETIIRTRHSVPTELYNSASI